ncbi:hypothetical protein D3C75_763220 [compost metagenome]
MQHTLFHVGGGQHDGAGHQGDVEFLGQATEQLLVVRSHLLGFHAQVRVGAPVVPVGTEHGQAIAQRVAQFQPLQGFAALRDLVQLVLFPACPQPGADVLR